MASPVIRQHIPFARTTAGTSVAATWGSATLIGSRLLAIVTCEMNGINNVSITPPSGWTLKTPPGRLARQSAGVDEVVVAIYSILNSAPRSGTETFAIGASVFANIDLVEVTGSDPTLANDLAPTNFVGNGLTYTVTDPGTAVNDDLALHIAANGNPASTQTGPAGWTIVDDVATTGGTDRARMVVYSKAVAAGAAVGAAAVTVSGATNRNLVGVTIVLPGVAAAATTVSVVQENSVAPAQATSVTVPWPAATTLGNRLVLVVATNDTPDGVATVPSVPAGWTLINPPGSISRLLSGVNYVTVSVYEKLNAAVESGNVVVTFPKSVYAYAGLMEISGSSTSVAIDRQASAQNGGLTIDTGATTLPSINNGMAIGAVVAGNVNSLSPVDPYTPHSVKSSTGAASSTKLTAGMYTLPMTTAGAQQLRVTISGTTGRPWAGIILVIPASGQGTGGGGGGGSGGAGIGQSPFFPDLDDGKRHGAASLHFGTPVDTLAHANTLALKYDAFIGTYSDTGGQFNNFIDDMYAVKPNGKYGFYGKSAQYQGSQTKFPRIYYARTAGGGFITTFNGNVLVMQPDGAASYADPRGFTSTTWKQWIGKDHQWMVDHENNRWAGIDPCNLVYGDSMGTSSYKGTQVSPTDGHTYTANEWKSLVWSIGDAMRSASPSTVIVCGNGLISGPAYANAKGLMDHIDMGLMENWIRNNFSSVTSFQTATQWEQSIDAMLDCQITKHKAIWVNVAIANSAAGGRPAGWVTPTNAQIDRWHRYAYASYLLGQRGAALYEFVEDNVSVKHYDVDHPYWNLDLGAPLDSTTSAAAMKSAAGRCHARRFLNGLALCNPQTTSSTFVADREYKDPITSTVISSGSTITLTANTGLVLVTTTVTNPGQPNSGGPTVLWNTPATWNDTAVKLISVTITDPDGVATPGNCFQDGVDRGAWTNAGGGTFTKSLTFVDGVPSTVQVTVADLHTTPLTTIAQKQFTYASPPPPPPPPPEIPQPPPPIIEKKFGRFATHVLEDMAPVNFR